MNPEERLEVHRFLLRDTIRKQIDFRRTDQSRGVPAPPLQKPCPADSARISLPDPGSVAVEPVDVITAIARRSSRRSFSPESLTLGELGLLLWATQGLRKGPAQPHFRTVPSAGARHAFETYPCVTRVDGIEPGIYRYLPLSHELVALNAPPGLPGLLANGCYGQGFVAAAAATLVWTALPYRMEWRYGLAAHKVILLDAGHVAQNLYLAVEAIGAGTCAIAAYDQEAMDGLLGVDGLDEHVIYLAPVGKFRRRD
jgi:SagB-type dehydrogenase family enzyme